MVDSLKKLFPPSKPCSCEICLNYCQRPGWWSVDEATQAIDAGYAYRIMLEISPEFTFGVLSPAFKGNEGEIAVQLFSQNGCTFLCGNLCELFGTGFQPMECRYCHHTRKGVGKKCHSAIEMDWHSQAGQRLVIRWMRLNHVLEKYGFQVLE